MPDLGEAPESRYMTPSQVAHELQVSRATVYNRIYSGDLLAVSSGSTKRSALRISRKSFNDYCDRLERDAEQRFQRGAA